MNNSNENIGQYWTILVKKNRTILNSLRSALSMLYVTPGQARAPSKHPNFQYDFFFTPALTHRFIIVNN